MRYDLIVLLILLLCIALSDYKTNPGRICFGQDYLQDPVYNILEKSRFCSADLCPVIVDDGLRMRRKQVDMAQAAVASRAVIFYGITCFAHYIDIERC